MDTTTVNAELQQKIEEITAKLDEQTAMIAKMQILINYYEEQLLLLRRQRFGPSSEKTIIDNDEYRQIGLFNEDEVGADKQDEAPELEEISYERKKRKGKRE